MGMGVVGGWGWDGGVGEGREIGWVEGWGGGYGVGELGRVGRRVGL